MKIVVLSDTHGRIPDSIKALLSSADYAIHAGDIGSLSTFQELKSYQEKFCFVRGNCDRASWANELPEQLYFHLDGIPFYVIHNRTDFSFRPEKAQIIICGHTHKYALSRFKRAVLLNPGSCSEPRGGEPASCAIITTSNGKFDIKKTIV